MPLVRLSTLEQLVAVNVSSDPGAIGGPKLVPSCAEITIDWLLTDGKFAHNVLHGRYTGSFTGSTAQCNAILAALTTGGPATAFLSHLASGTILGSISIRDVNTANQALISGNAAGAPGTGAGSALPNEVAVVITKHTALAGRANRGRIYIPGYTVSTVTPTNVIDPAAVTDTQAWADTIQNALNGQGYQLVIGQPARAGYTGSTGTVHPARAATSTTVTSLVVRDNHWDSQRRRGLK